MSEQTGGPTVKCPLCEGAGFTVALIGGGSLPPKLSCSRCNGTGRIPAAVSGGRDG